MLPTEPTVDDFFELAREVLRRIDESIAYPILKLSGGEIFLYDRLTQFVASIHSRYSGVQILTNGALISREQVRALADFGNVSFQVSLDGVTRDTNIARSRSRGVLQRILATIGEMIACQVGVEINVVLTRHNAAEFADMAAYFATRAPSGGVTLLPRPVRGPARAVVGAAQSEADAFVAVLDRYEELANVLPPRQYLDRVAAVLSERSRSWPCYVPFFVFGANNYGHVHTCTCSDDLPDLGSVLDDNGTAFSILADQRQYNPQTTPSPCVDCITQYELFNLFGEGSVSIDELAHISSFRVPGVPAALSEIRDSLRHLPR